MTACAVAAVVVVVAALGCAHLRDRRAERDRRALLGLLDLHRLAAAEERRELYQRIQAPEVAVAQAIPEGAPGFVPFDNDDAYHDAVGDRAVSDG